MKNSVTVIRLDQVSPLHDLRLTHHMSTCPRCAVEGGQPQQWCRERDRLERKSQAALDAVTIQKMQQDVRR